MPNREDYRLERKKLGEGAFAVVYRATLVTTGELVAFKASKNDDESRDRMRREIQEQQRIKHPNVVPILDHDPELGWFTMPLAVGDLYRMRNDVSDVELVRIVDHVSQGLSAAHQLGLLHRDVTPRNILAFGDSAPRRWAIGDWGLVRRPRGMSTVGMTAPNQQFGTEGFAAPELWEDAHDAKYAADVYSLGRVVAWALTHQWPKQNIPLYPRGTWNQFVRLTTTIDASKRLQTMADLQRMLDVVRATLPTADESPAEKGAALAEKVRAGDVPAMKELMSLGLANLTDDDLFLDCVVALPAGALVAVARNRPEDAVELVRAMSRSMAEWGQRDFDYANSVLQWIQDVARVAADEERWELAEEATMILFEREAHWERFEQRRRTRNWLEALNGEAAKVVAGVLAANSAAAKWYLGDSWSPSRTPASIQRAFTVATA